MSKLISIIILSLFALNLTAQYGPQYTHFMFNKMEFNPAYVGNNEVMTISALYRHQWQGIIGAPRTATVFGHTPFSNNRGGIGLSITSDRIGMTNSMYAKLNYAYRMKIKEGTTLSFGLNGVYEQSRLDWSKAQMIDVIDHDLPVGQPSLSSMNFGVGLYFQTPKFYIGASVPYLLKNSLYNNTVLGLSSFQEFRHMYLMSGVILPVSSNVLFKPSAMISYIPNAPFEMDMNAMLIFNNTISVGAGYRLDDSVSGLLQFKISRQMKLGASYDYTLSDLSSYNVGSFEVMMEYIFDYENEKLNNIRFF